VYRGGTLEQAAKFRGKNAGLDDARKEKEPEIELKNLKKNGREGRASLRKGALGA